MNDKDDIARSVAAYKGYLTRTFKEVDRYKTAVTANPDEMAVTELQSAHSRLLHYSRIVEAGYVRLQVVDYTQFHTYATKIVTMGDELAEASDDVMRIVSNSKIKPVAAIGAPPAAAVMPAYAAVAGGRVKPNDTLKPPMLSLNQSPEEMRVWADKFKAFYLASQLDRVSLAEQQAYLFVCLDSHMAARIKDEARADTPIMEDAPGEESCLSLIEKEFEVKYPKFIRRLKFFQYRQSPGQLFSDYAAKLHKIGNEADLGSVGVEELYIYKYISGTCDDKLREKFLKEQNPTWEDMAQAYKCVEIMAEQNKVMLSGDVLYRI